MHDQTLFDRLAAKTRRDASTGCWLWTGYVHKNRPHPGNRYGGYSIWDPVRKKGRTIHAHRAMMIAVHGPLTPQQCACHRCDNPVCINPNHLFVGSMKENIWDSRRKLRHYESRRDYCERDHPLFGDNVRTAIGRNGNPKRQCKTCEKARYRIKMGWPEALAYDMSIKVPHGHRINRETGAFEPIDLAAYRRATVSASPPHTGD